jgi:hypothetical protein
MPVDKGLIKYAVKRTATDPEGYGGCALKFKSPFPSAVTVALAWNGGNESDGSVLLECRKGRAIKHNNLAPVIVTISDEFRIADDSCWDWCRKGYSSHMAIGINCDSLEPLLM